MKKLIAVLIGSMLPFQVMAEAPKPETLARIFEKAPRHEAVMAAPVKTDLTAITTQVNSGTRLPVLKTFSPVTGLGYGYYQGFDYGFLKTIAVGGSLRLYGWLFFLPISLPFALIAGIVTCITSDSGYVYL